MTILDPCNDAKIELISPSPQPDKTLDISETDSYVWNAASVYTIDSTVDCGPVTVFYEQKDSSDGAVFDSLNTSLFTVNQSTTTFNKLSTDASLADTYEI